jgi:Ras-related GTP-binding protein A/B
VPQVGANQGMSLGSAGRPDSREKVSQIEGSAILLVGARGAGKRTIRSILLGAPSASAVDSPVQSGQLSSLRLFGSVVLCLLDLELPISVETASQLRGFLRTGRVLSLVFIVDVSSSEGASADRNWIRAVTELTVAKNLPALQRYIILHKTDVLPDGSAAAQLRRQARVCCEAGYLDSSRCFRTSIWDSSLYHAWSTIARSLVPDIAQVQEALQALSRDPSVRRIVLLESTSLLVLGYAGAPLYGRPSLETEPKAASSPVSRWLAWFGSSETLPRGQLQAGSQRPAEELADPTQSTKQRSRWPWRKLERWSSAPLLDRSELVAISEPFRLKDAEAFEKMSLILKRLKLACMRTGTMFQMLHVRKQHGDALLEAFTPHTLILVHLRASENREQEQKRILSAIRETLKPAYRSIAKLEHTAEDVPWSLSDNSRNGAF